MSFYYTRPAGILAGFHADLPDPQVPELLHIGEQWAPRQFLIPRHSHDVWEFYVQISGESVWDGPDGHYTLSPGGFFAVAPHVLHQMRDQPLARHHFLYAALDLAPVRARLPETLFWPDAPAVYSANGETLLAAFRALIREVSLSLPHRTTGIRLAVDALVLEAARLCETPARPLSLALHHPAVLRTKEMLDHQPGHTWRLADLARLAGVSARHLVACFTREVGVSPHRYLLSVRIALAQEMLAQTDLSVTDLALELGFSSGQHFAATFKRLTGTTAQGYRQKQRVQPPIYR